MAQIMAVAVTVWRHRCMISTGFSGDAQSAFIDMPFNGKWVFYAEIDSSVEGLKTAMSQNELRQEKCYQVVLFHIGLPHV